jgi:orotidine-5'-phosphate decarboxylase
MAAQLVIALDNMDPRRAQAVGEELIAAGVPWLKVGLELYTRAGPTMVESLKTAGAKVFLDLKLHDIPNTVEHATKAAAACGADLLTVHTLGGAAMMAAAVTGAQGSNLKIVGVTLLTSHGDADLSALLPPGAATGPQLRRQWISSLSQAAAVSGLQGLVCSALDLEEFGSVLRAQPWKTPPLFVTPGIRPTGLANQDQKRVATPREALAAGATHLVVGRPVTNPPAGTAATAAAAILAELNTKS